MYYLFLSFILILCLLLILLIKIKVLNNKVNKFTLYVGLNDKDTKKQKFTQKISKDKINKIFAKYGIQGATYFSGEGLYTYDNTQVAEKEKSFKIEILFVKKKQVLNAINAIKTELNQESVAMVQEKIKSSLV